MGISKNNGTPKSSILVGFSHINHPFWGIPIFGNIQMDCTPRNILDAPSFPPIWCQERKRERSRSRDRDRRK